MKNCYKGDFIQTFLPNANFKECARVIDNKRLWKQILEADGIIRILEGRVNKKLYLYRNHPCVRMWKDNRLALYFYRDIFISEWLKRRLFDAPVLSVRYCMKEKPSWLGNKKLHASHRAALLAKNYDWYKQYNWSESPVINYYWP